jgi:hypothetical protein
MTKKLLFAAALLLVIGMPRAATTPPALELFVDASMGNDLGSCRSPGNACRTIQAAVDRIPIVLSQDVTVRIAPGTYREHLLLVDRLAPLDQTIRLVGAAQAPILSNLEHQGSGVTIRRFARVVLENLTIEGFANGVHVRLSEVVISNTRITGNAENGILCEKGWVALQAADGGPGVTIQNSDLGTGINATCGCHVSFEGASWIGQNGTGIAATLDAVINLNGRSDITLANGATPPPPAPAPAPPTNPPVVQPPGGPRVIQSATLEGSSPQCEMVADHQGMIMGYANARVLGACACEAKDLSLCHEGTN